MQSAPERCPFFIWTTLYRSLFQKRPVISACTTKAPIFHLKTTHSWPTGWRSYVRCLIFIRHFLQKSPIISGSFAKRDVQFKASCAFSPPCALHRWCPCWCLVMYSWKKFMQNAMVSVMLHWLCIFKMIELVHAEIAYIIELVHAKRTTHMYNARRQIQH